MLLKSLDIYREESKVDKSDSASLSDKSEGGKKVQLIPRKCMSLKSRYSYREESLYDKYDSASLSDETLADARR